MKRILAAALVATSISAFAAWERVGALQVADMTALGEASSKVGQMVGNPMVSAGVASAIADMSTLKFFGPMRPKTTMVFTLMVDSDKLSADPKEAFDEVEYAVLYPISLSKEEFIKRHEGAFVTNGVVVVKGDIEGDDLDDEKTYVVFSRDGKWVAASDKVAQCHIALKDICIAEKSMEEEVVRLMIEPLAFKSIVSFASKNDEITPDILSYLKSVESFVAGAKVTERGVDIVAGIKIKDGSALSHIGYKPLKANPLAFAGRSSFSAVAQAEDAGARGDMTAEQWKAIVALCKKHKIDIQPILSRNSADGKSVYTVDIAALLKFFQEGEKTLEKFDFEKFVDELAEMFKDDQLEVKGPASAFAFSVKGFESQWTLAERFSATLPEVASKKPFYVGFFSFSSLLKSMVPHLLGLVPEEQREAMKPFFDSFAVEQKCALASAYWREGDEIKIIARVSSDEIRGLGGILTGVMSMGLMNAFGGEDVGGYDLDEEVDLDDDED